jgi:very-short-patch-repair endonuclease
MRSTQDKMIGWQSSVRLWEKLKPFARQMRQNPTDAERFLWECVRDKRMGIKFRRQHVVGPYILDFYASSLKLAIELDGGGHAKPEQIEKDRKRDAFLSARGIRVVRIWNNELFQNPEGMLEFIWRVVHDPTPNPSP